MKRFMFLFFLAYLPFVFGAEKPSDADKELAAALEKTAALESYQFKIEGRAAQDAVEGTYQKNQPISFKAEKIEFFQKRRHETQPLDQPNMGSVFKNPPKHFAAQMIEELGLKGVRVGGARLSEKHSNWIVNEGGATAKDVLALIGLIRDKVKEATGIRLETEVKVVGEDVEESARAVNL